MPPADIRWLLALTAPRVRAAHGAPTDRELELDDAVTLDEPAAIETALQGGTHLTRAELARVLSGVGIIASGSRLAHIVMHAELDGLICSGPRRGKQFTYALLDERAPQGQRLEPDEALSKLTRRYFTSHGPALAQDFAWWSGLTVAQVRRGIEAVRPALMSEMVDGKTYWFTASSTGPSFECRSSTCSRISTSTWSPYRDRGGAFDPSTLESRTRAIDVLASNSIVLNGLVVGTWQRTIEQTGSRSPRTSA